MASNHYVRNKDLYDELVKCKDASIVASEELIQMFYLIAENLSRKFTYKHEEDRQDCIQTAVIDCYTYSKNFNPKYKNAFAYITQIQKNGFAKAWRILHRIPESSQISVNRNEIYNL